MYLVGKWLNFMFIMLTSDEEYLQFVDSLLAFYLDGKKMSEVDFLNFLEYGLDKNFME